MAAVAQPGSQHEDSVPYVSSQGMRISAIGGRDRLTRQPLFIIEDMSLPDFVLTATCRCRAFGKQVHQRLIPLSKGDIR